MSNTYVDGYMYGQHDALTWLSTKGHADDHALAAFDERVHLRAAMCCLSHNLRIAAALCRAFRLGFDTGWGVTGEGFNAEYCPRLSTNGYESMASYPGHDDLWRPGCHLPAPDITGRGGRGK